MLDIKPIYRHRLKQSKDYAADPELKIYECIHCGRVITDTENTPVQELEESLMFEPCRES